MNIHEQPQFCITIRENGRVIKNTPLFDPIHSTFLKMPRGFKSAWQVFRRGVNYTIKIDATNAATRVIFEGDYSPEQVTYQAVKGEDACAKTTT